MLKQTEEQKANFLKWIEMLESGEYKQGNSTLKQTTYLGESKFCCLGVCLDMFDSKDGGVWTDTNRFNYKGSDSLCLPPYGFMKELFGEHKTINLRNNLIPISTLTEIDELTDVDVYVKVNDWITERFYELNNSRIPYISTSEGRLIAVSVLNDCGFTFKEIAKALHETYIDN